MFLPVLLAVRIAVVGDIGAGTEAIARGITRLNRESPIEAIVTTGDNIYPCGVKSLNKTVRVQHRGRRFRDARHQSICGRPCAAAARLCSSNAGFQPAGSRASSSRRQDAREPAARMAALLH